MLSITIRNGRDSNYRKLHYWVEKQLGKPQVCTFCGDTSDRRYHWANKSGDYLQETTDWIRLCAPCHDVYDKPNLTITKEGRAQKSHCISGHDLTPENTYVRPTGYVDCRVCRKISYTKSNAKKVGR